MAHVTVVAREVSGGGWEFAQLDGKRPRIHRLLPAEVRQWLNEGKREFIATPNYLGWFIIRPADQ